MPYGIDTDKIIKFFQLTRDGRRWLVRDVDGNEQYRDTGPKRWLSEREKAHRIQLKQQRDAAKRLHDKTDNAKEVEDNIKEQQRKEAEWLQKKEKQRSGEDDNDDDLGPPPPPPIPYSNAEIDYQAAKDRYDSFIGPNNDNRRQGLQDGVQYTPDASHMSAKQEAALKLQNTMKRAMGGKAPAQPNFDKAVQKIDNAEGSFDIKDILPFIMGSGVVQGAKELLKKVPAISPTPVLPSIPIIIVPPIDKKKDDDKVA